jgi:hypothetical protein
MIKRDLENASERLFFTNFPANETALKIEGDDSGRGCTKCARGLRIRKRSTLRNTLMIELTTSAEKLK